MKKRKDNNKEICLKECLDSGFIYGGVQYGYECFCGNKRPDKSKHLLEPSKCNMTCPGDPNQYCGGYLTMNIFQTGYMPQKTVKDIINHPDDNNGNNARIVYLLTVSGRAVRQVKRLVKRIYHKDNYILIHVDSRQDYMFREMQRLAQKYPNVRLTKNRFATIWGGASLLQMLISSFDELLAMKDWKWDFVMNLSESDYPVKRYSVKSLFNE